MVDLEDPLRAMPVDVSDAPDGLRVTFVEDKVPGTGVDEPEGVLVLKEIVTFISQQTNKNPPFSYKKITLSRLELMIVFKTKR